jgi:2,3-bisphosphoglycerate-dependent phosphoglycerate mutase
MESTLILLRHGQSVWNQKNLFTGWVDVPLDETGVEEAKKAGKQLSLTQFDVCFTSTLIRAQMTLALCLLENIASDKTPVFLHDDPKTTISNPKLPFLPVKITEALNERYYGRLQGMNKLETSELYGRDQVKKWRRSYKEIPPDGESLEMTAKRTLPYFFQEILPVVQSGKNVLVVAHGNSLRSIVMHLNHLNEEEVINLEIPTGKPIIYRFKEGSWVQ